MAAVQFVIPYPIVAKPTNIGCPRAKAYFYEPGTTTLKAIYTDASLTTQQANPLTADGAGRFADIYLDGTTTYKLVLKDKAGATLYTKDPYTPGTVDSITGPQGPVGTMVGEISAASYSPAGDGTTNDRTALSNADTAAAAASKITALPAGTYLVNSDLTFSKAVRFANGAKIKPASGVTVHFTEGYTADDWNQCFDISAGGIVTGDKAPMGYVTPQHFGADPTDTAVDDRPAIEAATEYATLDPIRTEYAGGYPVKFPNAGDGNYYLTKTRPIYIARTTRWFTDVPRYGSTTGGTRICAADGLDAVAFCFFPGGSSAPAEYEPANATDAATPGIGKNYSGLRSHFEDLYFAPESGATVRQGFVANAVVFMDRCGGSGFTEAGCHLHAQTSGCIINAFAAPGIENAGNTDLSTPASTVAYDGSGAVYGNVNGSRLTDCAFHNGVAASGVNGGSYGIVIHGNNAGTVRLINPYCNGNQGAGILENTTIGSTILGSSTAANTWKVSNGGNYYNCIKYHTADAASEPGVGASWTTYWVKVSATTADSAWALDEVYHPSCGINVCSASSRTTILDGYTEGGIEAGVIVRDKCEVRGGNACERAPWHGEFNSARVTPVDGSGPSSIGYKGQITPGDSSTEYGASLGGTNGFTNGRLFQFGDARDDSSNTVSAVRLAWSNGSTGKYYSWTHQASGKIAFAITGTGFSKNGYTGGGIAYAPQGVIIGNGTATSTSVARIFAGAGTPEAAITASVGALYLRTDGGAATSLYVKESGTGNTGWVAK